MTQQADREAFEKWASTEWIEASALDRQGSGYKFEALEYAWQGWQVAYSAGRDAGLEEAIKIVMQGRTINNFAHVPNVVRALEWIWMDLGAAKSDKGRCFDLTQPEAGK